MGYLPPGIYEITWTEFLARFGFNAQQERFGGELLGDPLFQGFLQTDRDGVSRGIIALDPRELLE